MNKHICNSDHFDRTSDSPQIPAVAWITEAEKPEEDDDYTQDDLDLLIEPEFDETFQDIIEMDVYGDSDLDDCFHA